MTALNRRKLYGFLDRVLIGALLLLVMLLAGIATARAGQLVPSLGMTRAVDGDDQVKVSGGLAFRGNLAPMLMTELGVSYRSDEYFNGDLTVHQWPVTASLYLTPVPALYAGAGVGWYHTTLDYADGLGLQNSTNEKFGVHLGGGLQVPLAPMVALDLGGRYVFMEKQESPLVPEKFNPDFWTTSLGLAPRSRLVPERRRRGVPKPRRFLFAGCRVGSRLIRRGLAESRSSPRVPRGRRPPNRGPARAP